MIRNAAARIARYFAADVTVTSTLHRYPSNTQAAKIIAGFKADTATSELMMGVYGFNADSQV